MFGKHPIADSAFLLSDPARVSILTSLLGGESRPAGELARLASLSPQAATAHLSKMVDGGLLSYRRLGRHHYYQIAKPEVGLALEALAVLAPPPRRSLFSESKSHRALRYARTCYDHLAGQLAIQIWDGLAASKLITTDSGVPELTRRGEDLVTEIGIDVPGLRLMKRPFTKTCLDWTERKHHLAGALGSALLTRFREHGWVSKTLKSRAIRVTADGEKALKELFSVSVNSRL
jgi:DNA-binding transcriptional ArsR family regulator